MAAYAEVTDFEAYVEGWVTDDEDALDRLLERASVDVDTVLPSQPRLTTGLKFDPEEDDPTADGYLTDAQKAAVIRATCAQAEYRFEMGEAFFVRAQHQTVRGPDFETQGELPYIGPKVRAELQGCDLLRPRWESVTLASPYGAANVSSLDFAPWN